MNEQDGKLKTNGTHVIAETTPADEDELEDRLEDVGLIKPPDGRKFENLKIRDFLNLIHIWKFYFKNLMIGNFGDTMR